MNFKEMVSICKETSATSFNIEKEMIDSINHVYVVSDKGFLIETYGKCALIRGHEELIKWCKKEYNDVTAQRILDGDNFYKLEERLRKDGIKLEGEHLRFLYHQDTNLKEIEGFTYKLFNRDTLEELYVNKGFDMALSYKVDNDVIALVAYKDNEIAGIAAADDYNKKMWQIGIDVIEKYRSKGLASYLVYQLTQEIVKHNVAVQYTTWGANISSLNVAIKAGFRPVMSFYYGKKQK